MADGEKTTIIAKVGAKIYPVTKDFYREAKAELRDAERRLNEVPVELTLDDKKVMGQLRELLAKMQAKTRDGVKLPVDLNGDGTVREAKTIKSEVDKALGSVELEIDVDKSKKILDDFKRANLFEGLSRQEIFDPASLKQYNETIKETLSTVRATEKLERQRAIAFKAIASKQAKALQDRIKQEKELAKLRVDERSAAGKAIKDELNGRLRINEMVEKANKASEKAASEAKAAARAQEESQRRLYALQASAEREMRAVQIARVKSFKQAALAARKFADEIDDSAKASRRLRGEIEDLKIYKLVKPEVYGELRSLQTELDNLNANLRVTVDPEDRERIRYEASKIKDQIEDELSNIEADINPDVSYAGLKYAQAQLAKLARARIVTFIPRVSKAGATQVATALAALSGARLSNEFLEDIKDLTKNLDKSLPKIAALSVGILTLVGYAGQAGANLFSLLNSIASIGPAALGLPGILGGLAIGIGTTVIAFGDFNKRVPEFKKAWKDLKGTIQDNFWARAEAPIKRLGKELFPDLKKGIAATASELGGFFGKFADGLRTELKGNPLKNMFEDLRESIDIASDHTASFAKIIRILGESGAGLLPRMAKYFGDLTDRFSKFLDKADKNGSLQRWINDGIKAMMDLGNVIKQVVRIFAGLGRAAEAAGASTLKTLGKTLKDIADVVNGPVFQKALIGTLRAANEAMETIAKTSGPSVNKLFLALADTLQIIFPMIGRTVGKVIKTIADVLSSKDVQYGIVDFFAAIERAVNTLAPAFKNAAPAIGELLSLLATAITAFAPLGAVILDTVFKAFIKLAPAINDVVVALSGAFLEVLKALAPVIVEVAEALAPIIRQFGTQMAEALKESAPYLAELAKVLGDALGAALKIIGDRLPDIVSKLLPQLLDVVKEIVPKLPGLVDGFLGLVDALVNTSLISDIGDLAGALVGLIEDDVLPKLAEQIPQMARDLGVLADVLGDITSIFDKLDIFGSLYDVLISGGMDPTAFGQLLFNAGSGIMSGFLQGLQSVAPDIITWLAWLTDMIPQWKGPPDTDSTLLFSAGASILQSLLDGMKSIDIMGSLKTITQGILSAFAGGGTLLFAAGGAIVNGLKNGMKPEPATTRMGEIKQSITDKLSNAASFLDPRGGQLVKGLAGGMGKLMGNVKDQGKAALAAAKDGTNGADTSLKGAGISVIEGFVRYIRDGFYKVRDVLRDLTNMLPEWKGPPSTDKKILANAGVLVIEGFIDGLKSQFSSVRDVLGDLSNDIARTQIAAPDIETADIDKAVGRVKKKILVTGEMEDGTAAGGVTFNIIENNPVAEPKSVAMTKALRTARGMGY